MSFSSLITPVVSTCVSFVMNNNEFQETIIHIVGNDSHICLDSNLYVTTAVTTATAA